MFLLSFACYLLIVNEVLNPKGSIKLYQKLAFSSYEEAADLWADEVTISKEAFEEMQQALSRTDEIAEYSIYKNGDQWVIVSKSPDGNNKIRDMKLISTETISQLSEVLE